MIKKVGTFCFKTLLLILGLSGIVYVVFFFTNESYPAVLRWIGLCFGSIASFFFIVTAFSKNPKTHQKLKTEEEKLNPELSEYELIDHVRKQSEHEFNPLLTICFAIKGVLNIQTKKFIPKKMFDPILSDASNFEETFKKKYGIDLYPMDNIKIANCEASFYGDKADVNLEDCSSDSTVVYKIYGYNFPKAYSPKPKTNEQVKVTNNDIKNLFDSNPGKPTKPEFIKEPEEELIQPHEPDPNEQAFSREIFGQVDSNIEVIKLDEDSEDEPVQILDLNNPEEPSDPEKNNC